eukprot:6998251-Prymnesium_polylepis.1
MPQREAPPCARHRPRRAREPAARRRAAGDEPCERRDVVRGAAARPLQPCTRGCLRLQPPPWPNTQRGGQLAQEQLRGRSRRA